MPGLFYNNLFFYRIFSIKVHANDIQPVEKEEIVTMDMKKKKRSFWKKIVGVILLYYIIGALVPFMFHPKAEVSEAGKKAANVVKTAQNYGNSEQMATILETSNDALDARLQIFDEAKEKIILSTFDIRLGKSTNDVFSVLLAAADRGVQVEILVDGMAVFSHMKTEPLFYAMGTHENIKILSYNQPNLFKPWTFNGRLHDKYIIVDDQILLAGGRNTFDYFLGEYNMKNLSYDREFLLYDENEEKRKEGTAIAQVEQYYEEVKALDTVKEVYEERPFFVKEEEVIEARESLEDHYESIKEEKSDLFLAEHSYKEKAVSVGRVVFLTNPTGILAKKPVLYYDLISMMEEAKNEVYIHTPYVVLSKDMKEKLTKVCEREIPTKMQVNSIAVGDNVMASSDYLLRRKGVLKTGVELYEFQGDHSSHGKSLYIDEAVSVIGSFNFDMRSAYLDTETMFVIEGKEFTDELKNKIQQMEDQSILVTKTNQYEAQTKIEEAQISKGKDVLYRVTSIVFQLIRYLI